MGSDRYTEVEMQRLMEMIFPTRYGRTRKACMWLARYCWLAAGALGSKDERGPLGWLGDRCEGVEMWLRNRAALRRGGSDE